MTNPIDSTPQGNFPIGNLPPDTAAFYNSKAFANNEIHFLGTMISMMQKGLEEGLQQIEDAINGQT